MFSRKVKPVKEPKLEDFEKKDLSMLSFKDEINASLNWNKLNKEEKKEHIRNVETRLGHNRR